MEFDLIARLREQLPAIRKDTVLGIGDDGACLQPGGNVVVVTDTLVSGVHFFPDTAPADIGWKSLAVNLSDLAAMGARPAWALLNLTLPAEWSEPGRDQFVDEFAAGFGALARQHQVDLVGGDTTSGPLSVTVTALGLPSTKLLTRNGAQVGDLIVVSGTVGDAAWACDSTYRGAAVEDALRQRLLRPQPRIALGLALAGLAHSGLDVSDGLLADLNHLLGGGALAGIAGADRLGADIHLADLPTSKALAHAVHNDEQRWQLQLSGGDDYELLFTLPPEYQTQLEGLAKADGVALTVIGVISAQAGIRCHRPGGALLNVTHHGFQHFQKKD